MHFNKDDLGQESDNYYRSKESVILFYLDFLINSDGDR